MCVCAHIFAMFAHDILSCANTQISLYSEPCFGKIRLWAKVPNNYCCCCCITVCPIDVTTARLHQLLANSVRIVG